MSESHRCTIIPPYMLEAMLDSDDAHLAEHAREALDLDIAMRQARRRRMAAPTAVPTPAPRRRPAEVVGAGPRRTIGDAESRHRTPGKVVRTEGDPPTGDAAVDEAYDGLGATWDLWWAAYERDSLDGKGMPLLATVHYGTDYDNAFWDGRQMVFGDGDGVIFERFTRSLDVIGHELAHGVTEHTAGLLYQGQSGALNESISDVFGVLVKQRTLGQTAEEADWLVGADLLTPSVAGRALRDMLNPGTAYDDPRLGSDPQPAHMDGYVETDDDNGGVHINSGIPNRAFVLAALAMGGHAWDEAGAIWYAVVAGDGIRADCDFATFADLTQRAAATRHGEGSPQHVAVRDGWTSVGVLVESPAGGGSGEGSEGGSGTGSDTGSGTGGDRGPAGGPRGGGPDPDAELLLRRTGGFAGLVRERDVALRDLPERDAKDWQHLLAAPTLQRIAATSEQSHPDAYCYSVRCPQVDVDVTVAEPHLPEAIHQLFERTLRQD